MFRLESLFRFRILQFVPQRHGIINLRHVCEVSCVRNSEHTHSVGVTPFREVTLERFRTSIFVITAYLALEVEVETVKFVQPIRNRFAIPTWRGNKSNFQIRIFYDLENLYAHLCNYFQKTL